MEIERDGSNTLFILKDEEVGNILAVDLTEKNLFDLIGRLLRIQSEIKKGGNNE